MSQVSISSCCPCGYQKPVSNAAAALRSRYGLGTAPGAGTGGSFEVKVGDSTIAKRGNANSRTARRSSPMQPNPASTNSTPHGHPDSFGSC